MRLLIERRLNVQTKKKTFSQNLLSKKEMMQYECTQQKVGIKIRVMKEKAEAVLGSLQNQNFKVYLCCLKLLTIEKFIGGKYEK